MDSKNFDRLTTELATSTSRRTILGALAAGGFLGALGRRPASAHAQADSCTLEVTVTVRLGPSAGQVLHSSATQPGLLSGRLRFAVTVNGELDRGVLLLEDGTRLPVVGDASGRTLTLRISVDDDQTLVAVGVGQEPISSCTGPISGMLTGPQLGDLGDWQAIAEGRADEEDDQGSTNQAGSGGGSSGGQVTATVTPMATANPCPDGEVLCGNFCRDLSYDDFHCGRCDNPCPSPTHYCEDGVCVEAVCPPGTTNCMGYCAELSSSTAHCGTCGNTCGAGQSCCSGICVDLTSNPAHCGACGAGCLTVQLCQGGVCRECTPGGGRCGTNTLCCAGMGCAPDTTPDRTMRCL